MLIGVPKEIKPQELRVGLTPESVAELCHQGHEVLVETQAGAGIGAGDADYAAAGARIAPDAATVFAQAELIVKVKEPQPAERARLRPGQVLFTFLHLAPDPEQARDLLASGAVCIAYETVTDGQGGLPLLKPMSQVAGRLAVLVPGAAAPRLVTRAGLCDLKPGTVLVDVAIDQGGCFETSRPTTHAQPIFIEEGIVHYCVANMPGAVPRTSAYALNNATLPAVLALAGKGWRRALTEDPHLCDGLNCAAGRVTHPAVAEALGLDFSPRETLLA